MTQKEEMRAAAPEIPRTRRRERRGEQAGRLASQTARRNWQDQVQIEGRNLDKRKKAVDTIYVTTMVRSLLILAFIASVLCSANAASQVGGSIRGSTAVGTESSASSALASAASSLLKVWPHPAAQVLHHATSAVRRKLVSAYSCAVMYFFLIYAFCPYLVYVCEKNSAQHVLLF